MASTALIARDYEMGTDTRAHAAVAFCSARIGTTVSIAFACGISTASHAFVAVSIFPRQGTGRHYNRRERQ